MPKCTASDISKVYQTPTYKEPWHAACAHSVRFPAPAAQWRARSTPGLATNRRSRRLIRPRVKVGALYNGGALSGAQQLVRPKHEVNESSTGAHDLLCHAVAYVPPAPTSEREPLNKMARQRRGAQWRSLRSICTMCVWRVRQLSLCGHARRPKSSDVGSYSWQLSGPVKEKEVTIWTSAPAQASAVEGANPALRMASHCAQRWCVSQGLGPWAGELKKATSEPHNYAGSMARPRCSASDPLKRLLVSTVKAAYPEK